MIKRGLVEAFSFNDAHSKAPHFLWGFITLNSIFCLLAFICMIFTDLEKNLLRFCCAHFFKLPYITT